MPTRELDVSVRSDQEDRSVGELAADELEQLQRVGVGPVEVVENEYELTVAAQILEDERRRVEKLEAGVPRRAGGDRRIGRLPSEPRDEISDLGRTRCRPGRERFAGERPQRLQPGPVRRCP